MLLFYNTTASELPALRERGVCNGVLHSSLAEACKYRPEVILVVDALALANNTNHVPPDTILNLDPYLAPRDVCAAGGIVCQGENMLLIYRNGVWDLPKGKCHVTESVADCALREVTEETGVRDLRLGPCLGETIHGYAHKGRYHVKTTTWFLMHSRDKCFVPQTSEGIEHVAWVSREDAAERVGYATLARFLRNLT